MNDQNPTTAPPPAPSAEPAPKPAKAKDTTEAEKRYAAYDKTYLRFVTGTFDTRTKARDNAKDKGVTDFEIREV